MPPERNRFLHASNGWGERPDGALNDRSLCVGLVMGRRRGKAGTEGTMNHELNK